jgi:hypothetical protein
LGWKIDQNRLSWKDYLIWKEERGNILVKIDKSNSKKREKKVKIQLKEKN